MYKEQIDGIIKRFNNKEPIAILLSKYYSNDSFYNELIESADKCLFNAIRYKTKLSEVQSGLVVVSLAMIAQKYYDNNFFGHVKKEYKGIYEKYSETPIYLYIKDLLEEYVDDIKYFDPSQKVAVPIVASVVPHYRMADLFSLAYDIYKKKLLFEPELSYEQIYEAVNNVFKILKRKDLISEAEEIKGTQYKMSRYTQSCIYSGVYLDDLIKFTSNCIKYISDFMSNEEIILDKFYEEPFKVWKSIYESNINKDKEEFKFVVNKSGYYVDDCNVILRTKNIPIDIDDVDDIRNIEIGIYCDGLLKYTTKDFDIIRDDNDSASSSIGAGIIVKSTLIDLVSNNCDFLNKLSYKVLCSNKVLFDSKETLFRNDFIAFDESDKEIKNLNGFFGQMYIATRKTDNPELNIVRENGFYNIYSLFVDKNICIMINNNPYIFGQKSDFVINAKKVKWAKFVSKIDGTAHDIYTCAESLNFITNISSNNLEIYDNDILVNYSLSSSRDDIDKKYTHSFKLNNLKAGYHHFVVKSIYSDTNTDVLDFGFVYDPTIKKSFIENSTKLINIETSFYKDKSLKYSISKTMFDVPGFVPGLGNGNIFINTEMPLYSIDNKQTWKTLENRIFFDEIINNKIYIQYPSDLLIVYSNEELKTKLNYTFDDKCNWVYVVDTGYISSLSQNNSIVLELDNNDINSSIIIDFVPVINSEKNIFKYNAIADANRLYFSSDYTSKVKLEIADKKGEIVFTNIINLNENIIVNNLVPFEKYNIRLYYKKKNSLLYNKTSYYSTVYFYFGLKNMQSHTFCIQKVDVEKLINKKQFRRDLIDVSNSSLLLKITNYDRFYNINEKTVYFGEVIIRYREKKYVIGRLSIDILDCTNPNKIWATVKRYTEDALIERDPEDCELLCFNFKTNTIWYPEKIDANMAEIDQLMITL